MNGGIALNRTTDDAPAGFAETPAAARYREIIDMERPAHDGDLFSRRHPRMPRLNRAKIFAPFAALVGFDDRVRRKEVAYVPRHALDADEERALDRQLYRLHRLTANARLARENAVRVAVEHFCVCTDAENDAYGVKGVYETATGVVLKVDRSGQALVLGADGGEKRIAFGDIRRVRAAGP